MKNILLILFAFSLLHEISAQQAPDVGQVLKSANDKLKRQDFTGSIRDFNKALRMSPGLEEAYRGRAEAKYYIAQYDEALRDINKAIDVNKDIPEAYLNPGTNIFSNKTL